jgi:hypothetical protein
VYTPTARESGSVPNGKNRASLTIDALIVLDHRELSIAPGPSVQRHTGQPREESEEQ